MKKLITRFGSWVMRKYYAYRLTKDQMTDEMVYLMFKRCVINEQQGDVMKEFVLQATNLDKLLAGKQPLYDMCRILRLQNNLGEQKKSYTDAFVDIRNFIDAIETYKKIHKH